MNKHNLIIASLTIATSANLFARGGMTATLADHTWKGDKIPDGRQCQKFGGHGTTPRIRVNNIPKASNAIVVEYSDTTYKAMDNGGHGKIGYHIDKRMLEVTIPPIKVHTFDLPKSFFIVKPQQAPKWDKAGAYLPPCSGGKGNLYVAQVKAVHISNGKVDKEIATVEVNLGVY